MPIPIPNKKRVAILKVGDSKFLVGDKLTPAKMVELIDMLSEARPIDETYIGGDTGYIYFPEEKSDLTIGFELLRLAENDDHAMRLRDAERAQQKPENTI